MIRNLWAVLVFVVAVSFLSVETVSAQSSKGIIVGVVHDPSGAVVPGAAVTVIDSKTQLSRTTTTDGNGTYRFEALDPSFYTVHVVKSGFNTIDAKGVEVVPSQTTSSDVALVVGSEAQQVTVTADSNAINTENGQISGTVAEVEIAKLPVFSLSAYELAATIPGVSPVNPTLAVNGIGGNGVQLEVNGARPRANNFLLDGQDINDTGIAGQAFQPQQVDAYQSVAVLTNSSSAEYGRAGGAVVNTISKTGTNRFHGTVYDLYLGSGLNSQDGSTRKSKGAPKARFDRHIYGFDAGGPIIRDKLFLFGGTQFNRFYGNGQAPPISVPDAAGYATLVGISGPQSLLLQQYLVNGSYLTTYTRGPSDTPQIIAPRPGCPNGCTITTAQFFRPPVPQQNPDTQWIFRIDFTPRSTDSFFYRYLHDRQLLTPDLSINTPSGGGSGLPGLDYFQGGPAELALGGWTHVFSPNLLNEFRAGETRISFFFLPLPATLNGPLAQAFNIVFTPNSSVLPPLGINQNFPQGRAEDLYQIQDTVGWTHGRQSFRIGVDLGRQIEKDLVSQNAFGSLTFQPGPVLSDVDEFLNNNLGPNGVATKSFGPTRIDPHTYKTGIFVQDDIKLTPELTVNVGLRYDFITPPENGLKFPAIDQNNPFAPIDQVFKAKSDTNNFGPRAGFAFAPRRGRFLNGDMVFHGGFGVFYDIDFSNLAVNNAQGAPDAPSPQESSPIGDGSPNATGIIPTFTPDLSPFFAVQSTSNRLVAPVTYQYNFGFERALPGQLKLTVNYVGNRSDKLFLNQQYNYRDPVTRLRIHPDRGVINARINDAISNYNSIQTEVSHRFGHGLFVSGNYVYGKDLDDSSEVFGTFASPTSYQSSLAPGTHISDYGPSVWDHRHFFSVAYVYSPAGFHSGNGAGNALLGTFTRNFTFSGLTQLQSGSYSSFGLGGVDTNKDGSSFNDRPILSNSKAPLTAIGIDGFFVGGARGTYYDLLINNTQVDANGNSVLTPIDPATAHFLVPRGGAEITPQEIGRNSFENPGTTTWNMGVEKDLPISKFSHLEGAAFQFRVEAQNVFNHNDVGIINNNILQVGSPSYLNPVNARVNTNRNVRAWIKFAF